MSKSRSRVLRLSLCTRRDSATVFGSIGESPFSSARPPVETLMCSSAFAIRKSVARLALPTSEWPMYRRFRFDVLGVAIHAHVANLS